MSKGFRCEELILLLVVIISELVIVSIIYYYKSNSFINISSVLSHNRRDKVSLDKISGCGVHPHRSELQSVSDVPAWSEYKPPPRPLNWSDVATWTIDPDPTSIGRSIISPKLSFKNVATLPITQTGGKYWHIRWRILIRCCGEVGIWLSRPVAVGPGFTAFEVLRMGSLLKRLCRFRRCVFFSLLSRCSSENRRSSSLLWNSAASLEFANANDGSQCLLILFPNNFVISKRGRRLGCTLRRGQGNQSASLRAESHVTWTTRPDFGSSIEPKFRFSRNGER